MGGHVASPCNHPLGNESRQLLSYQIAKTLVGCGLDLRGLKGVCKDTFLALLTKSSDLFLKGRIFSLINRGSFAVNHHLLPKGRNFTGDLIVVWGLSFCNGNAFNYAKEDTLLGIRKPV